MKKLVNVHAKGAVRTVTPPIYGDMYNIELTTGMIYKCMCARAIVDEVMPDGSTLRLNASNYDKDNTNGVKVVAPKQPEPKVLKTEKAKEEQPTVEPVLTNFVVHADQPVVAEEVEAASMSEKEHTETLVLEDAVEVEESVNVEEVKKENNNSYHNRKNNRRNNR